MGLALGLANLIAFWVNPLDDSLAIMLIIYAPMFIGWCVAGFVAGRRTGHVTEAMKVDTLLAFATFNEFIRTAL